MKASDYHAFLWDMAGPDFRVHICRLCGLDEMLAEFKWHDLEAKQQQRVSNTMASMLQTYTSMQDEVNNLRAVK